MRYPPMKETDGWLVCNLAVTESAKCVVALPAGLQLE